MSVNRHLFLDGIRDDLYWKTAVFVLENGPLVLDFRLVFGTVACVSGTDAGPARLNPYLFQSFLECRLTDSPETGAHADRPL